MTRQDNNNLEDNRSHQQNFVDNINQPDKSHNLILLLLLGYVFAYLLDMGIRLDLMSFLVDKNIQVDKNQKGQ
jgi:hypothetical protein